MKHDIGQDWDTVILTNGKNLLELSDDDDSDNSFDNIEIELYDFEEDMLNIYLNINNFCDELGFQIFKNCKFNNFLRFMKK